MEKNNQGTREANSLGQNPLGVAPMGGLIAKFAIPAIISMQVSAMYNIVDQIFIGQGVGMLGNAATNVAFPVTTIATALALLLGIGGASYYNGSRTGEEGQWDCRYGFIFTGNQWCDSCGDCSGVFETVADIVWGNYGCDAVCG